MAVGVATSSRPSRRHRPSDFTRGSWISWISNGVKATPRFRARRPCAICPRGEGSTLADVTEGVRLRGGFGGAIGLKSPTKSSFSVYIDELNFDFGESFPELRRQPSSRFAELVGRFLEISGAASAASPIFGRIPIGCRTGHARCAARAHAMLRTARLPGYFQSSSPATSSMSAAKTLP